jgi:tRNA pseudouridine38-40 synthase
LAKIAALVEYDGTDFAGWQSQTHSPSIQDELQSALSFVAGHSIEAVCAGRTDTGVHAVAQVVHFETTADRTARTWVLGTNTRLPASISLQWAGEVEAGFHARHAALLRSYRYCILNRSERSALQRYRAAWIHRPLDVPRIHSAAQVLIGEHDFSAFRSAECQSKTAVRRVERLNIWREGDYVWLDIAATAFLHHMVRNIAGTLIAIGDSAEPEAALAGILAGRERRQAGPTASAAGLYLWQVDYPPAYGIPKREGWVPALP